MGYGMGINTMETVQRDGEDEGGDGSALGFVF
jgi:hypothetical protein